MHPAAAVADQATLCTVESTLVSADDTAAITAAIAGLRADTHDAPCKPVRIACRSLQRLLTASATAAGGGAPARRLAVAAGVVPALCALLTARVAAGCARTTLYMPLCTLRLVLDSSDSGVLQLCSSDIISLCGVLSKVPYGLSCI